MLALVLVGFSATLYLFANSYLHRQAEERLETILNTISGAIEAGPEGVEWEPANRHLNLDFSILGDQVVWLVADDQGQVVDRSKGGDTEHFLADTSPSLRGDPHASGNIKLEGATWQAGQRWFHAHSHNEDQVETSQTKPIDPSLKYPALSITAGVSLTPIRTTLRQLGSSLAGLSVGI